MPRATPHRFADRSATSRPTRGYSESCQVERDGSWRPPVQIAIYILPDSRTEKRREKILAYSPRLAGGARRPPASRGLYAFSVVAEDWREAGARERRRG